MDIRDDLEFETLLFGEDEALNNITIGKVKQDNIECCICLNYHWGVKLPNCSHFICPKCYYKLLNGYISEEFYNKKSEPKYPEKPIYPYQNKDKNKDIFYIITEDDTYLEWFIDENEDLYKSVKLNSEFVDNLDVKLKRWFEHNKDIKQYENDLIQYNKNIEQFNNDIEEYNELYAQEKEANSQKICPLCRL
jgi:hypothetical protein